MLNNEQKYQLIQLIGYKEEIANNLFHMESILKQYFPKEYNLAYQHWIPQILTALHDDDRWLSRGQYSVQDTIDHIHDTDCGSGVNKYIK
ncbi:hypothetical protein EB118_19615 [bacterium]|nr:hypothetical protein [bacterium]NDC95967.1 hypothetical protein [bacterium]NDD85592.1 hypothetical protein [bacterium]NDG32271.1 hypothetical protein [bacterium]